MRLLAIRIVRIARNAIHIFKNVAGLAIQCRTDGGEGGKRMAETRLFLILERFTLVMPT